MADGAGSITPVLDPMAAVFNAAKQLGEAARQDAQSRIKAQIDRLPSIYRRWLSNHSRETASHDFRAVCEVLASSADAVDRSLIKGVAGMFKEYLERVTPKSQHKNVVKSYVDTLSVLLGQAYAGDGGALGSQLLLVLRRMNDKFAG